jgi:hypothetical protein
VWVLWPAGSPGLSRRRGRGRRPGLLFLGRLAGATARVRVGWTRSSIGILSVMPRPLVAPPGWCSVVFPAGCFCIRIFFVLLGLARRAIIVTRSRGLGGRVRRLRFGGGFSDCRKPILRTPGDRGNSRYEGSLGRSSSEEIGQSCRSDRVARTGCLRGPAGRRRGRGAGFGSRSSAPRRGYASVGKLDGDCAVTSTRRRLRARGPDTRRLLPDRVARHHRKGDQTCGRNKSHRQPREGRQRAFSRHFESPPCGEGPPPLATVASSLYLNAYVA